MWASLDRHDFGLGGSAAQAVLRRAVLSRGLTTDCFPAAGTPVILGGGPGWLISVLSVVCIRLIFLGRQEVYPLGLSPAPAALSMEPST